MQRKSGDNAEKSAQNFVLGCPGGFWSRWAMRSEPPLLDPPTHGLNIVPFASMAGGWLGPLMMFWLYIWGPLRPFAYPSGELLPGAWFLLPVAACIALWWALPDRYFRIHRFERSGRLYERLGVLVFRKFAPNGDFANRWERRKDPSFRLIRFRKSAIAFIVRTRQSERGHIVLLALGAVSAAYAWSVGWHGWAAYLTAGNVLVNLYPVLLQRYTRGRIEGLLSRCPRAAT